MSDIHADSVTHECLTLNFECCSRAIEFTFVLMSFWLTAIFKCFVKQKKISRLFDFKLQ